MGYLHIDNFYKDTKIQLFKQCYALEKLHGTSAHLHWNGEEVTYFSGGENFSNFYTLFDNDSLVSRFKEQPSNNVTVYGEAYGGKQQGQSWRYGKKLKFTVFDVKIDDNWLNVPSAERYVNSLGLEFVPYKLISTDIKSLDVARDSWSEQAKRNGVEGDKPMEGVVLRPLLEMRTSAEKRVIVKHKRAEERETKTVREPKSPEEQAVLDKVEEICEEYVTPIRLEHVLDKLKVDGKEPEIEDIPKIIKATVEDVVREASGEIVDNRDVRVGLGKKTVSLFKKRMALIASGRVDLWPGFVVEKADGTANSEILT